MWYCCVAFKYTRPFVLSLSVLLLLLKQPNDVHKLCIYLLVKRLLLVNRYAVSWTKITLQIARILDNLLRVVARRYVNLSDQGVVGD